VPTTGEPRPPLRIAPILAINFVGTLGFAIVLPFLVFLVTRLGGNALIYGVMGATYSFFQLVGAPILGRWSDRFGRRRILLLSQLGTMVSWGIFLIALALPVTEMARVNSPVLGTFTITVPLVVLFLARALDGITGGNVSVANAYLADVTPDSQRTVNFGRMSVAGNLGFIAGPAIAGLLGTTGWGEVPPVVAALLISAVASVLIAVTLQDRPTRPVPANHGKPGVRRIFGQEHKPCYTFESRRPLTFGAIVGLPGVALLLALEGLVFLAFNFYYVAFPVYVTRELGWTLARTGAYFAAMGVVMVVAQGPVLSRLSKRYPDRTLVTVGGLVLGTGFALMVSRQTAFIYGAMILLALGNGVMWPSLLAALSRSTEPDIQGAVQGLAGSGGAVASIVGLVAGGVLFGVLGPGLFVVSGVIAAVAGLLGLRVAIAEPPQPQGGQALA